MSSENPNVHSNLGQAFTSDGVTIVHAKERVVLDFKKTTPRIDHIGENQRQTLVIEHQPISLQPHMAKVLLRVLQENLEKYEEKFGEIDLPKQSESKVESAEPEEHSYIG